MKRRYIQHWQQFTVVLLLMVIGFVSLAAHSSSFHWWLHEGIDICAGSDSDSPRLPEDPDSHRHGLLTLLGDGLIESVEDPQILLLSSGSIVPSLAFTDGRHTCGLVCKLFPSRAPPPLG